MKLLSARCGHIDVDIGLLEGGGINGNLRRVPSMCFIIEHPEGLVLWDTSMHPCICADPTGYWGRLATTVTVPHYSENETLLARLAQAGIDASQIRFVINSHLHNDHCGMNRFFPQATVLLRRSEFDHAVGLMDTGKHGYVRDDFYGDGQTVEMIEYDDSFDVFDDGRLKLLSTVGHTPGHQSLQVTFPSGRQFVMTGDALYTSRQLATRQPPGLVFDKSEALVSANRLADLGDKGATVLIHHEPGIWSDKADVETLWQE
ncbi:MAG: N-acyl homoserine lactonase family protein [Parvibaculum sp.]